MVDRTNMQQSACLAPAHVVDARGLRCPLPLLRVEALARRLPPGALLRVMATDPAARADLRAVARQRGWQVVSDRDEPGGGFVLDLRLPD